VLLQNIHLTIDWTSGPLNEKVDKLAEGAHDEFRLFLSAEPPPGLEQGLPISLLKNSIKLTNEPPQGILQNLKRAFVNFTDEIVDSCAKQVGVRASYPSRVRYILHICHPIGRVCGIFAGSGILLVTCAIYSQCFIRSGRALCSICHLYVLVPFKGLGMRQYEFRRFVPVLIYASFCCVYLSALRFRNKCVVTETVRGHRLQGLFG
jgi:hypothetical protein